MARKKNTFKAEYKKRLNGLSDGLFIQLAKEVSTIPAYAMRELTGQPHGKKQRCTLKKGWFE